MCFAIICDTIKYFNKVKMGTRVTIIVMCYGIALHYSVYVIMGNYLKDFYNFYFVFRSRKLHERYRNLVNKEVAV